ncbi:hypothetical protein COEREDRAFT_81466 [Coemansia reversa NRRL 1564]|uniref:Activator of Hsp90 ATPase AHSA1-like N-terminal domain-containing protein n=1 Tax=Coemansia reversa (strain ATCC 12441 / NRRL 1564) TaxID=763665 RepID=A0A2G5BAH6_COERN|nr:hypothetical protein COEREDRAFT_81466 [Coemansia reversa NRRL 1564]|eukprot:PIA16013.1 hypothetical protein COEREDRAFT_81466 [Coemansia reversa NRRL 1564]
MADWRNVGNWHWTTKNCFAWANTYIKEKLTGVEVKGDGIEAKVTSVTSVNGDVDLSVRKEKLIAIYDVEVKLSWEATKGDEKLTGEIKIPEVANDMDKFVYEVTSSNTAADMLPLRGFVREKLAPKVGEKLKNFTQDLKQANGSEMYIPDNKGKESKASASGAQQNVQLAKDFKEGKAGTNADVGVAKAKDATFGTVTVKQTAEFMCSVDDLFATLTDPQRVTVWTRGPAEIQPVEGKKFKLFGGHIEGEITKLVPGKTIEQTWRVATWPSGHYSKVIMNLEQLSTSTRLTLVQTGVPLNEESATKANWERYYWNSIKGSFGTNHMSFTYPPYNVSSAIGNGVIPSFANGGLSTAKSSLSSTDKRTKSTRRIARKKRNRLGPHSDKQPTTNRTTYIVTALSAIAAAAIGVLYMKSSA